MPNGSAEAGGAAPQGVTDLAVQHLGRNKEGWQVAETTFFRIFHNQSRDQIEKIAAVAENTRRDMYRKWFGAEGTDWADTSSPRVLLTREQNENNIGRWSYGE